ncbi:MAG TPA: hypothetical protein VEW42_01700 [Candidatus Eisenbacteria bacterium]|nr:hypothetical protein [Candidatus Eisenbacteria bacterium]
MKIIRNILLAFFVVACLAYVNVIIPKPQTTEAHVENFNHSDSCGRSSSAGLKVTMGDDACGGYFKAGTDYQTTGTVTNTASFRIDGIQLHYKTYFCLADSETVNSGGSSHACLKREKDFAGEVFSLNPGESKSFSTPVMHPSDYPDSGSDTMCGLFQNDFWFSYNNGACTSTFQGTGTGFGFAGVGYCKMWDGSTLSSTNPWLPSWECGQKHKTCQNNACVTVNGAGSNSCTTDSQCQPQTHKACVSNACSVVQGPGQDMCSTDSQCQPQTHKACVSNACSVVQGPGADTCATDTECQPQHHNVCQNNACVQVDGAGENSCVLDSNGCSTSHLKVIKIVNNNHGGTKEAGDFVLKVNGTQVTNNVSNEETPGDYTVSEDAMDGYHQVSMSGDCDANGHVHLDNGDNKTCVIQNEDNGGGECTMPTCNTSISGCSYPFPDTKTCSCGPLVCITNTPTQNNITVNVNQSQSQQQQQQQKQEVLGASVAPAVSAKQLPSTGSGAEVLLGLFGLLPIGLKLRRFV